MGWVDILCHSDASCAAFLLVGFCNPLWRLVPSISGVEVLPMAEERDNRDLYKEIGEIKGKQEMMVEQLARIEDKLDGVVADVSKVKGKASVWGALTAALTTVIISLGLKRF